MDALDASVAEGRSGVWGKRVLDFGALGEGRAFVRRDLRFGGGAMAVLGKDIFDVAFHIEPSGAIVVVPGKVNISILGALPVPGDGVVLFRISRRWRSWRLPTYSIPKLSMIRDNWMGCHLYRHRPDAVADW